MTHILICDDNQNILRALSVLLLARGFSVCLAQDPQQALFELDGGQIDLAMIDFNDITSKINRPCFII